MLGLGALDVGALLGGCAGPEDTGPAAAATEMDCSDPRPTALGVPTARHLARLTTTGGRLQFVVRNLPTGSILGGIDDTEVLLGQSDDLSDPLHRVRVSPTRPGVVDVGAGTYWVLNTNRGQIDVTVCPDVTISEAEVAQPEHPEPSRSG